MADLGKSLDFDPSNPVTTPDTNVDNSGLDTTPDVIPDTTTTTPGTTPDAAPAVKNPELLNSAAWNIGAGDGGINLLRDLGIESPTLETWDAISGDLPDRFPGEFYREFEPSGHVDERISHQGALSEEARKVILQRLGR